MGAVKKVFKSVGSLFGIGGQAQATPTVEKVAPAPTSANGSDVSGDTGSDSTTKKKRRGFASTQTSLASSESDKRNTLG